MEAFANELDGAVERRASGGGVADVEDSGDATVCLGEDEVSCVRLCDCVPWGRRSKLRPIQFRGSCCLCGIGRLRRGGYGSSP